MIGQKILMVHNLAQRHLENKYRQLPETVLLCLFEINIYINSEKMVLLNDALNSCSGAKYSYVSVTGLAKGRLHKMHRYDLKMHSWSSMKEQTFRCHIQS